MANLINLLTIVLAVKHLIMKAPMVITLSAFYEKLNLANKFAQIRAHMHLEASGISTYMN